jgi:hypothetical protein
MVEAAAEQEAITMPRLLLLLARRAVGRALILLPVVVPWALMELPQLPEPLEPMEPPR